MQKLADKNLVFSLRKTRLYLISRIDRINLKQFNYFCHIQFVINGFNQKHKLKKYSEIQCPL